MKLPDGTYKLSRNVKNPERNLRNKRDWTCFDQWEEGDCFFLRTMMSHGEPQGWQELQLKGHSRTLPDHNDAFALILMASERIEETPSLYLTRNRRDDCALDILDHMFECGTLRLDFIQACLADMDEKNQ